MTLDQLEAIFWGVQREQPPRELYPLEFPITFPQPWKCPGCSRWNAPTSTGCECHKGKDDKQ